MHEHDQNYYQNFVLKTVVATIVGGILFICTMFDLLPSINTEEGYYINCCLAFVTLAVMIYCGKQYYVGAWRAFMQHYATMDTLIALGTGAAWIYSCIVLIFINEMPMQQDVYFESTNVIIAFVNFG